jgi:hypothetical protein
MFFLRLFFLTLRTYTYIPINAFVSIRKLCALLALGTSQITTNRIKTLRLSQGAEASKLPATKVKYAVISLLLCGAGDLRSVSKVPWKEIRKESR